MNKVRRIVRVLGMVLIFFVVCELLLQLTGYHEDGRMYALGSFPYRQTPTLREWKSIYFDLNKRHPSTPSFYEYDSLRGWRHGSNFASSDGLYHFNNDGIRASRDYSPQPLDSLIRLVMLGNSVILSAEVADSQTIGFYLEKALIQKGYAVEVLNMGVGSFGNDQALLHWRHQAKNYQPDLVLQGVHIQDFWINLNIYKYCMFPPTGIAYSKPKAIINNANEAALQWLNYPTVAPDEIVERFVVNFEQEPFYPYEYFNTTPRFYQHQAPLWEGFFSYQIINKARKDVRAQVKEEQEGQQLMHELLKTLQEEVEATGGQYVMLQLTSYNEILRYKYLNQLPHQGYWQKLSEGKNVFTTHELLKKVDLKDIPAGSVSHYSPMVNQKIAIELSKYLIKSNLLRKKAQ